MDHRTAKLAHLKAADLHRKAAKQYSGSDQDSKDRKAYHLKAANEHEVQAAHHDLIANTKNSYPGGFDSTMTRSA